MTAQRFQRVAELFDAAWSLPPPQRMAFLDSSCGDDPDLRREVDVLLQHASGADSAVNLRGRGDGRSALVLGTIGTAWQAYRATQERNRAEVEKGRAESALKESEKQREIAQATNKFLNEDVLGGLDPARPTADRDLTISDVIARTEKKLDSGALRDTPAVEAAVQNTLSYMNRHLGRYEASVENSRKSLATLRRLFGEESGAVAITMNNLGDTLVTAGKLDEAEPLLRQGLERTRRLLGPRRRETAVAAQNLATLYTHRRDAASAEPLFAEALDIFRDLPGDNEYYVLSVESNRANLKRETGDYAAAVPIYRAALERRPANAGA